MTVIASASIRCSCVGLRDQCALFGLDIGRSDHLSPHVDLDLDANVGAVLSSSNQSAIPQLVVSSTSSQPLAVKVGQTLPHR
jgi:hypothetical protein